MHRRRSALALGALAAGFLGLAPSMAAAQDAVGLQTPSHNIYCMLEPATDEAPAQLRCDLQQQTYRLPIPARQCDLSWGDSFAVEANSRSGYLVCHGDTTADPSLPVIPYGAVWSRDGFTCASAPTGLTCRNRLGHGFAISRGSQRLF